MKNFIMDNYTLYIRTVQSQSIKILVESLKEVLTDVNLYFDNNGLKIMTMDNARVALVYVRLLKDNFEEYVCNAKNMCGINMIYFFKLLKTVGNNVLASNCADQYPEAPPPPPPHLRVVVAPLRPDPPPAPPLSKNTVTVFAHVGLTHVLVVVIVSAVNCTPVFSEYKSTILYIISSNHVSNYIKRTGVCSGSIDYFYLMRATAKRKTNFIR